jgi:hypothetical protein
MTSMNPPVADTLSDGAGTRPAAAPARGIPVWVARAATGVLMVMMAASGTANLIRVEPVVAGMHRLGYPEYFPVLLGVAKLLAVVALALPGARRLKEWAYAGMTFDMLAALVAHAAVRDGFVQWVPALVVLSVLAVSCAGHLRRTAVVAVVA